MCNPPAKAEGNLPPSTKRHKENRDAETFFFVGLSVLRAFVVKNTFAKQKKTNLPPSTQRHKENQRIIASFLVLLPPSW
jgi:hypothetical protein